MPRVDLKIEFDDTDARRVLDALLRTGADLSPAFANIGEAMLISTEQRFNDEVDPDGRPWAPQADSTRKQKKHSKILTESTNLRGRIAWQAGPDSLEWGTDVIYGAIHQFGGQAGRNQAVTIFARPYLGISDNDRDIIRETLRDYLATHLPGVEK